MTDHFERLGLPRRFSVDRGELERAYLALSRAAHPDFYTLTGGDERAASEATAAAVNEAYATLKDPFRRAEHLLALLGGPTATEVKDVPPAFLMEMMDVREQIEAADAAGRERLDAEIGDRYAAVFTGIDRLFDARNLVAVRKDLNAAKYLKGLLRDLRNG